MRPNCTFLAHCLIITPSREFPRFTGSVIRSWLHTEHCHYSSLSGGLLPFHAISRRPAQHFGQDLGAFIVSWSLLISPSAARSYSTAGRTR
jgi:hypothetical protein